DADRRGHRPGRPVDAAEDLRPADPRLRHRVHEDRARRRRGPDARHGGGEPAQHAPLTPPIPADPAGPVDPAGPCRHRRPLLTEPGRAEPPGTGTPVWNAGLVRADARPRRGTAHGTDPSAQPRALAGVAGLAPAG